VSSAASRSADGDFGWKLPPKELVGCSVGGSMQSNGRQDPDQRLTGLATAVSARALDGEADLQDPSLYLNRELAWLDFNERVLQLAEDEQLPRLERVKFCAIYTTNLDEFYMVRVAGLHDQIDAGVERPGQDGLIPAETIALIRERTLGLGERLTDCFERRLRPALADHDIRIAGVSELDDEQRAQLSAHFQRTIFPALTPLAVAPGRPFPYISNLSLSLAVHVRVPASGQTEFVRVEVGAGCSAPLLEELTGLLGVREDEVYPVAGLLDMGALWQLVRLPGHSELREAPLAGITHPRLARHEDERPDVLAAMREGDLLVHHPYISFATSVERFVEQALADPNVLAIKQTVYRTSDDSPLVPALIAASQRA